MKFSALPCDVLEIIADFKERAESEDREKNYFKNRFNIVLNELNKINKKLVNDFDESTIDDLRYQIIRGDGITYHRRRTEEEIQILCNNFKYKNKNYEFNFIKNFLKWIFKEIKFINKNLNDEYKFIRCERDYKINIVIYEYNILKNSNKEYNLKTLINKSFLNSEL
jgi:hypothetical protein